MTHLKAKVDAARKQLETYRNFAVGAVVVLDDGFRAEQVGGTHPLRTAMVELIRNMPKGIEKTALENKWVRFLNLVAHDDPHCSVLAEDIIELIEEMK